MQMVTSDVSFNPQLVGLGLLNTKKYLKIPDKNVCLLWFVAMRSYYKQAIKLNGFQNLKMKHYLKCDTVTKLQLGLCHCQ